MSATLTLSGDWLFTAGNKRQTVGTGNLGTYATSGVAVTANQVGLGTLESLLVYPAAGYVFEFVPSTLMIKAYRSAAISASSGIETYSPGGGDIKGSANTNSANTDAASAVTNYALLLALDTFTNFAGTMTPTAQVDVGRNIAVTIKNDSGDALDLYEGITTFAVTGTWRGAAQTENITLTSTSGNKSVANSKFRVVYGSKPFSTVTSIAITNGPAGALKGALGIGSKIGLYQDLATPLEADVIKITKNAANLSPSGIVDTTNMTVNLGTLADGDDVGIVYKIATTSSGAQAALAEVTAGVSLSGVTFSFLATGR